MLSSRLTTIADEDIDWSKYDALKSFVEGFLDKFGTDMKGTNIARNSMVLQCLQLLLKALIGVGYPTTA